MPGLNLPPALLQLLTRPVSLLTAGGVALAALVFGTWLGTGGPPLVTAADRAAADRIVAESLARNPAVVQEIVKDYLIKNPDVMKQAMTEALKAGAPPPPSRPGPAEQAGVIKGNASLLFDGPRGVTMGNPAGSVTLVEFFDYNCGFCKRAMGDKLALVKDDPALRVVLRDYPVLGPGSREAALVGIAVRMQDRAKAHEFHRIMMTTQGRADKSRALDVAGKLGLDTKRLEADMASPEATATIEENVKLARALGITGTPSYVVGSQVVVGAVGHAVLAERIKQARK